DQGLGLSEPMNWEHASKLNRTGSFKALGSDDGHMGLWHGETGKFVTLTGSTVSAASCEESGACGTQLLAEQDEVSCDFESDW
ncbi:unnamed protein product, partial [Symbiodinium pilosum]